MIGVIRLKERKVKIPTDQIHESWIPHIGFALNSTRMKSIEDTLIVPGLINPEPENIFRVLTMPLDEVRVVIVGQEPYPVSRACTGYAFAIPYRAATPYSLSVIVDELAINYAHDITLGVTTEFDMTLSHWIEQGVFLLNRSLTCNRMETGSKHLPFWEGFTSLIVDTIAKRESNTVWLLWGEDAKALQPIIERYRNNHVLTWSHPAAQRHGKEFIGCKHFNRANEILERCNKSQIVWV